MVFWFASLVGIVAYGFAHWQSFRSEIFRNVTELNVDTLLFDTLQAAILVAVIFCAGATLQAIEVLSEYFVNRGPIFDAAFGEKLLAIFLLVILAVIFSCCITSCARCGPAGVPATYRRARADLFGCVTARSGAASPVRPGCRRLLTRSLKTPSERSIRARCSPRTMKMRRERRSASGHSSRWLGGWTMC